MDKINNLKAIAMLQDGLNEIITTEWKTNRTREEFQLESNLELSEFIEMCPHKFWRNECSRNVKADWFLEKRYKVRVDKAKLEIVDILHFALSGAILDKDDLDIVPLYNPIKKVKANEVYSELCSKILSFNWMVVIYQLIVIANLLGFDIMSFYIAKHTLNHIRQLRGMGEGKYDKHKFGKEDNDILLECISTDFTGNQLFDEFDLDKYERLVSDVYSKFEIDTQDRKLLKSYL